MKKSFEIGDIVTGIEIESSAYGITTDKAVMEVTEIIDREEMVVKIIDHSILKREIGHVYTVRSKYFKKTYKLSTNPGTMSNTQPVYWECKVNEHSKFWAANIIKKKVGGLTKYRLVRKWGRIGNNPQTIEQSYTDKHEVEEILKKLIWAKEQKGYKPVF